MVAPRTRKISENAVAIADSAISFEFFILTATVAAAVKGYVA